MEQITLRLPVRTLAELERDARDAGRSRSEHIRDILDSRQDVPADAPDPERVHELEAEIVELERKLERSQNAYQTLIEERQEKQELVRYVEDERTAQDKWRHAGLLTKAKWAVTGMPEERD